MGAVLLAVIVILFQSVKAEWTPSEESGWYSHGLKYELQIHPQMWLAYEVDEDASLFRFAMVVQAVSWVGFGPSETGSMIGGYMCVARDASAYTYYSTAMAAPTLAENQNVCVLLEFNQIVGVSETYAKMERPIQGCRNGENNNNGIDIVKEFNQRFIAAFGSSNNFGYHGSVNRVAVNSINPFYGPIPSTPLEPDVEIFDSLTLPYTLPTDGLDSFRCRVVELPNQAERYHVVRYEPVVDKDLVSATGIQYHHFAMYSCDGNSYPPGWEDGFQHTCWNSSYPTPPSNCMTSIFYMWSANQDTFNTYPAGYPFGSSVGITHVMLESHIFYPTPEKPFELQPWGMRLYYTPTLRPVEGQVLGLFVGIHSCISTPDRVCGVLPGYDRYELISECPQGCITDGMPPDGIVLQGVAPHAHALGQSTRLSIVRNNVELPPYHIQKSWDYNVQGLFLIHPNHPNNRILPGDRIMAAYSWNTTLVNNTIYWGESFSDEMANEWLYIYPRLTNTLLICKEQPGRRTDLPGYDQGSNNNGQCLKYEYNGTSPAVRVDLKPYQPYVAESFCPSSSIIQ